MKLLDMLEQGRFGKLTILGISHFKKYKTQTKPYFICDCDCGKTVVVRGEHLSNNRTVSCGCYNSELSKKNFLTHGLTGTPEYRSWISMRARVIRPDKHHKKYYKNITIDKRWDNFENFLEDMGKKPGLEYELDRIDNNGDYTPQNCHWVTRSENMKNTRRAIKYK